MIISVFSIMSVTLLRSGMISPFLFSSLSRVRINRSQFYFLTLLIGWKRVLLADGPRQSINGLTLYSFYLAKNGKGSWYDISKYFEGNNVITSALTISIFFTVVLFAGSLLVLIIAGLCYVPLLCHIQGNLKVTQLQRTYC
jgi:hypothetical protein